MNQDRIKELTAEAIAENDSLFLIDISFGADSAIKVIIDGISGVPLSECIRVSRHIEHNLDREKEDFSLEVTTPSITDPITDKRQYQKNLNRVLKVKTEDAKFEGTLKEVNDTDILLQWKTREPKPIGKGKVTVEKQERIPLDEIKQAKVKIIF